MGKKSANPVRGVKECNEKKECISHEKCASWQPCSELLFRHYPVKMPLVLLGSDDKPIEVDIQCYGF